MPRAKILLFGAAVVGVVWGAGWLAGCDDDPVGPRKTAPKDYRAYFYDAETDDSNWFFTYHPATNELDSVFLHARSLHTVSADGSRLYLQTGGESSSLLVLESDSFTVIDALPDVAAFGESPNGRYLAVGSMNNFRILDASSYSELYSNGRTIADGRFSFNSQRWYGYGSWDTVYRLDLSGGQFNLTFHTFPGAVRQIVPSPDESRWYLYLQVASNSQHMFAVYDVASDSLIFRDPLWPGYGEVEVTPNGRYVFYTNPGNWTYGPGPPWIYVYDAATNAGTDSISTVGMFAAPYDDGVLITQLYITPDGRWMVATDFEYPYVFAVDLSTREIEKFRQLDDLNAIWGLTGQNGL